MNLFKKFFDKDIEFLQKLNNSKKKFLVYIFILFIILSVFFLKKERIYYFFFLLSILLIWKILMEIIFYVLMKKENEKLKLFIRKYEGYFEIILKILLFIQKWKNPILVFLLFMDKMYYKIVRNIIYQVKVKYKYDLTNNQLEKAFYIYYLIINIMLGPLKFIFGIIYRIMNLMIEYPFTLFFIVRTIGFILSVLIFSWLYTSLYNKLGPLYLFLFFYFFIIFLNLMIKYYDRTFKKLQYINFFIDTDYLIYMRNKCTFIGILIITISEYKTTLIDKKYIDVLSSHFKYRLYIGFYRYWENHKRFTWLDTKNIWMEIKNRPSWYLYVNLLCWIRLPACTVDYGPAAVINIIYFKKKIEKLNLKVPEDIKKDLDFLYDFFLLRLKLLLFIIYDINDYIGNERCDYIICKYDKRKKIYDIESDEKIFDYFDRDNFKTEKKEKDLLFYDLESNIGFFDRLHLFIDIVPINEDPFEQRGHSYCTWLTKDLAENMITRLDRFYRLTEWNRGWHYHITREEEEEKLLEEKEVKDWIEKFLKETREDWYLGLKKENLEDRNWRMLKEIEDLFENRENKT